MKILNTYFIYFVLVISIVGCISSASIMVNGSIDKNEKVVSIGGSGEFPSLVRRIFSENGWKVFINPKEYSKTEGSNKGTVNLTTSEMTPIRYTLIYKYRSYKEALINTRFQYGITLIDNKTQIDVLNLYASGFDHITNLENDIESALESGLSN